MLYSKVKSYAKLNLALNIVGKSNSLHKIESIISFVNLHDLVLISERDFQSDKVDIIHKYQPSEVSSLKKYKELEGMDKLLKGSVNDEDDDDDNLVFDDDDEDIFEGDI